MELPKFLLGDNTDFPDAIFVTIQSFLDLLSIWPHDEVEWLEDFDAEDERELEAEAENLIQQATDFYDREITRYDQE